MGGSAAVIVQLVVGIFTGLSSGATVVISHGYGAGDKEKLHHAVHSAVAFSLLAGAIITVVGILLTPDALRWTKNPQEIMGGRHPLPPAVLPGHHPHLLFNMGAGILRAVGDAKRPLYYLVVCLPDERGAGPALRGRAPHGVAGAAIATTLANLTSALLILRQLTRTQDAYRLIPREIRIHKATLPHILGIGVPAAIESAMYAASSLLIQVPINTLGTEAVAAWSATSKVDGVYFALMVSFGVAIMAFVGQNYGAGKYQRMKQGVRVALTISLSITVALSILLMLFAPYCFRIFTDEPLVIQYAIEIMGYFVPFYFLWTCIEILANSSGAPGMPWCPWSSAWGDLRPADPVGLSGGAPLEHPYGHLHLLPRLLGGDGGRADPVLLPGKWRRL